MSGFLSSSPPAAPSLEDTRGIPTYTSDSEDEDTVSPSNQVDTEENRAPTNVNPSNKDTGEIRAPTNVSPSKKWKKWKKVHDQLKLMARIGTDRYELQEDPPRPGTPTGRTYFKYTPVLTHRLTEHGLARSPHERLTGILSVNPQPQPSPNIVRRLTNPTGRPATRFTKALRLRKDPNKITPRIRRTWGIRWSESAAGAKTLNRKKKKQSSHKTKKKRRTRRTSKRKRKPRKKSTKH